MAISSMNSMVAASISRVYNNQERETFPSLSTGESCAAPSTGACLENKGIGFYTPDDDCCGLYGYTKCASGYVQHAFDRSGCTFASAYPGNTCCVLGEE